MLFYWYHKTCPGYYFKVSSSVFVFPRLDQVCLAPSTTNQTSWLLDESGRLTCGSNLALDVPWEKPRTAVILYPKHSGQNQKWWLLSALKKIIADDTVTTVPPSLLQIVQCQAQPDLQQCIQAGGKSIKPSCTIKSIPNKR